jgi:hypothetical protein
MEYNLVYIVNIRVLTVSDDYFASQNSSLIDLIDINIS